MEVVNAAVFWNIAPKEYVFRKSIPASEKAPPLKMGPKKEKKAKEAAAPTDSAASTVADSTAAPPAPSEGKKEKKGKKEKAPPPPSDSASTVADSVAPPPPGEKPGKGGKKEKGKKEKPGAIPIVTDSINPFVDLPTAPPTAAPSEAVRRSKDKANRNSKEQPPVPPEFTEIKVGKGGPAALEHGQGMPPSGGKPGWRRVSTRQWIRDFRDHIGKFQTYPYKPICGMFFWSFGYYPDMVPQDSYQKYVAKHPISTRKHSTGSHGGDLVPTETDISMSSTTEMSDVSKMTTDDNMNLPPLLPPLPDKKGKGKKGKEEDAATEGKGSGKKGSKKGKGKAEETPSTTATETEADGKGKKGKGKKGSKAAETPSTTATETESAAEGSGKKDKKGKGKKGADVDAAAVGAGAAAVGAGAAAGAVVAGGKGKKGKKDDAPADPAAAPGAEGAAPAAAADKKGKKGKKGAEAEPGDTTATEASTDTEAAGKGKGKAKGKKGAEIPVAAVSGNISFDPAVYDLTSLTVMNLPAGADAKKLGKLFPGGKVTVDGAGATVKFKDVAAAQPFFTKDVSLDGQGLVVSPKLKS